MKRQATALDWSMYKTVTVKQMQDVFDLAMRYGRMKSEHTRIFSSGPGLFGETKWRKDCAESNRTLAAQEDLLASMLMGKVEDYTVDVEEMG